jgi:ABC-2 type transport system permease protein
MKAMDIKFFIRSFERIFESCFWALAIKEVRQIFRNKQLLFLLTFPPTVQLCIFGFALSPDVRQLKLGILDESRTQVSRELVAALTENRVFIPQTYPVNPRALGEQVRRGQVDVGVVIPADFQRNLERGQTDEVQVLVDGVNAYTAGVASNYVNQIVNQYSEQLAPRPERANIAPQIVYLYNPGLISSWFFVPGVMGMLLTMMSVLSSAVEVVKEKDAGTLEQLLMTPASVLEILMAKVVPLFFLLLGDVFLSLGVARFVFAMPFRGNLPLFMALSSLQIFIGISLGILLATVSRSKQQAILTSFFITLPMIILSGALAPIESMPSFFRALSLFNPLRHYITIVRDIMLKDVGFFVLWPQILALGIFAFVFMAFSSYRFRAQAQ